jgi:hypothetical protein
MSAVEISPFEISVNRGCTASFLFAWHFVSLTSVTRQPLPHKWINLLRQQFFKRQKYSRPPFSLCMKLSALHISSDYLLFRNKQTRIRSDRFVNGVTYVRIPRIRESEMHIYSPLLYNVSLRYSTYHNVTLSFIFRQTQQFANQLTHISLCITEFIGRTMSLHVSAHGANLRQNINKFILLNYAFCMDPYMSLAFLWSLLYAQIAFYCVWRKIKQNIYF